MIIAREFISPRGKFFFALALLFFGTHLVLADEEEESTTTTTTTVSPTTEKITFYHQTVDPKYHERVFAQLERERQIRRKKLVATKNEETTEKPDGDSRGEGLGLNFKTGFDWGAGIGSGDGRSGHLPSKAIRSTAKPATRSTKKMTMRPKTTSSAPVVLSDADEEGEEESAKLIVYDQGFESEFRLKPKDDTPEEGEINSDEDEDEDESEEEESNRTCHRIEGTTEKQAQDEDDKISNEIGDNVKKTPLITSNPTAEAEFNEVLNNSNNESIPSKREKKKPCISLFEMQSFLIALILPEPRLSTPPTWCRVLRCMRASNIGIFLLDNVDLDWIEDKAAKFTHGFNVETSPDWVERLTMVPLSRRAQGMTAANELTTNRPNGGLKFETDLNAKPKVGRSALLLSPLQMIAENYPMPFGEAQEINNIQPLRSKYYAVSDRSPMFGIDCEMCITDKSELTKISIVDEECRVVYNQLVKPDLPITNYLTRYSGITKEMMEHVQTKLEDVQYFMRKTLPRDAIFVGHSLNMDLSAIKIFHPYVIDTSVIYNRTGTRSYKPSLKSLAYEFLGKSIQTAQKLGHDSLEDAITALELVQLKIVNGLTFGDAVALEKSLGLKYDSKTGITQLQFDKFIDRHQVISLAYRCLDLTPGARTMYIHDKQSPLDKEVKEAILHLLNIQNSICVVMTNAGKCYVKI